ncbi:ribosomal protein S18 acetylase RimI-like enzyme [Burkholderia sp. OAS925]|jgi:ribosomal protein S18 acetylase RimI-like enzyme|uniref:GCN5-related N-acetyltransferase n=2 Tax=Burkholderiaceae TaxID=119060 RepID=B1G2H1_PARG4|nr:GCN5-related N-acetyltransferase [Paraburkholderia graminis C4D1M]MDR6472881.1 ribosomal protein S18 acetylase RimI-like enzyme [Paraburkholderia graminis]CAB3699039.1 Acetyltransferase YpeA [Paraburkholderia graminis C4D1M]
MMSTIAALSIRRFDARDTDAVIALWQQAFPEYRDATKPQRNPRLSIANKLATQPELFFVAVLGERVVGTVMGGYDGHRGWLYSLAVDESLRRHGIGSRLVAHVEAALTALGCPKLNLQVLSAKNDVRAFYEALGYRADEVVSFGKRLGELADSSRG